MCHLVLEFSFSFFKRTRLCGFSRLNGLNAPSRFLSRFPPIFLPPAQGTSNRDARNHELLSAFSFWLGCDKGLRPLNQAREFSFVLVLLVVLDHGYLRSISEDVCFCDLIQMFDLKLGVDGQNNQIGSFSTSSGRDFLEPPTPSWGLLILNPAVDPFYNRWAQM